MKRLVFSCLLGFFAYLPHANAWSNQGHRLIVLIAKSQLSKETVQLVDYYLQGQSWEDAACWMNNLGSNPKYKNLQTCHYVYFNKDKTYVKTKEEDCLTKLDYCMRMFQYRQHQTMETMNEILKMVFHLVGDLHQPLQCGYPEDKGGSLLKVKFLDKDSNLQKVWESDIIEEKKIDIWSCTNFLMSMKLTPSKKAEIEKIDMAGWMNESRALLPEIYKVNQGKVDQAYIDKNADIIEAQLIKAGLRLAAVLKSVFVTK